MWQRASTDLFNPLVPKAHKQRAEIEPFSHQTIKKETVCRLETTDSYSTKVIPTEIYYNYA